MLSIQSLNLFTRKSQEKLLSIVSLELKVGEIGAIVGKNGAGKTTLLKAISLMPDIDFDGEIKIEGENNKRLSPSSLAQKISWFKSSENIWEYLEVKEIFYLTRPSVGIFSSKLNQEDQSELDHLVNHFSLSSLMEKKFGDLSDGQKQIILLARAFFQRPRLLLLDEPTNFLDYEVKANFVNLLLSYSTEKNITVLFTSHDLDLVKKIAHKVWLIEQHQVKLLTPNELESLGV